MSKISVVVSCVVVASALSAAFAADQGIESLQGLPPLLVNVTVVAPIAVGIGEADLKTAIESRLKSSAIKLATGLDNSAAPLLNVVVTAPTGKFGLFGIGVTLGQFVKPFRPDAGTVTCVDSKAPELILTTWNKEQDGMIANGNPVIPTRELVERVINTFTSDYLKANPK